jgi:hypothetical protein
MTNDSDLIKPKKSRKKMIIAIFLGEFIIISALVWAMWFYIFKGINGMSWIIFLVIYIFILLVAAISIYWSRKDLKKRIKEEKESTGHTIFQYDDNMIEQEIAKPLRRARIIHIVFTPIVYLFFLMFIYIDFISKGVIPIGNLDSAKLNIIAIIFAIISILSLFYSFRLQRIMIKAYKNNRLLNQNVKQGILKLGKILAAIDILPWAMANAIFFYGWFLAAFGAGWQISTPFFVVSALTQVFIFPTRKKWKKIADEILNSHAPDDFKS